MDTRIIINNCERDDNELTVMPDSNGGLDLISFKVSVDGQEMPLSEKEFNPRSGTELYFHINKHQAKALIGYLQGLVETMN